MKLAFMGSDPIALPFLRWLQQEQPAGARLVSVHTQPDRRTGRGMKQQRNPIKQWALEQALPIHQPQRCGEEDIRQLRELGADAVLVMAYGQILRRSFLKAFPDAVFNLHASALPRLRGASPIETAIAIGLPRTAVSFMRVIPAMDAGAVADREWVRIEETTTGPILRDQLAAAAVPLLQRCLPALQAGQLRFTDQDPAGVTYCRLLAKPDARLDFSHPAVELARRVRAFTAWPGTSFPFGDQLLRIHQATALPDTTNAPPGTVLRDDPAPLAIACGKGSVLRIDQIQRPGGKALPATDFLRGFDLPAGTRLPSLAMPPLEAPHPLQRPTG